MSKAPTRKLQGLATALVAAWCLMAAGHAQAQWKWRDKDGNITVSDRPPPKEIADKDVLTRPQAARRVASSASSPASAASAGAEGGRSPLDKEVDARRKAAEQEQTAKAKADEQKQATQRAENCQRARAHVGALESGQRIARLNDKGEREVLDDKGRADELRQAREVIASDCR